MRKIFQQTKAFYIPSLLTVFLGALTLLFISTGDAILWASEFRNDYLNDFFAVITRFGEELTYTFLFILFLFTKLRYAVMVPIIGGLVTLVSFSLKMFFQHPRPKIYFGDLILEGQINLVDGFHMIGGYTSFPSGHTMSAFCIFGFTAYVFLEFKKTNYLQVLCFILAILVAISRVYLVQHFLKDIVLGGITGSGLALLFSWFCEKYINQEGTWMNQNIVSVFQKKERQQA